MSFMIRAARCAWLLLLLCTSLAGCPQPNPDYCDEGDACPQGQSCQLPAHVCGPGSQGDGAAASDAAVFDAATGGPAGDGAAAAGDLADPVLALLGYGISTIGGCLPTEIVSGPSKFYDKLDTSVQSCSRCACKNATTPCMFNMARYSSSNCMSGLVMQENVYSGNYCFTMGKFGVKGVMMTTVPTAMAQPPFSPTVTPDSPVEAAQLCLPKTAVSTCKTAACVKQQITSGASACLALPAGSTCPREFPNLRPAFRTYVEQRQCQCKCLCSSNGGCALTVSLQSLDGCIGNTQPISLSMACLEPQPYFPASQEISMSLLFTMGTCSPSFQAPGPATSGLTDPFVLCCGG